jgi:hypothetical protein
LGVFHQRFLGYLLWGLPPHLGCLFSISWVDHSGQGRSVRCQLVALLLLRLLTERRGGQSDMLFDLVIADHGIDIGISVAQRDDI